jgi:hypothetical protein
LLSGPEASSSGGAPTHLAQYAFRLPRSAGKLGWPRAEIRSDRLGLRFLYDPGKTDLDYRVVVGPDLSDSSGTVVFSSVTTAAAPDASCFLTIQDPVPVTAAPRRFGRVAILQRTGAAQPK